MIVCNLNAILAERNIKITKLSKDTGISRTTLTALTTNVGTGIQFDTLNSLCRYLKITPSELLPTIMYDITIKEISDRLHEEWEPEIFDIILGLFGNGISKEYYLKIVVNKEYIVSPDSNVIDIENPDVEFMLSKVIFNAYLEDDTLFDLDVLLDINNQELLDFFTTKLPIIFKTHLSSLISDELLKRIDENKDYPEVSFFWQDGLGFSK